MLGERKKANELFDEHYIALFDSESDKGQELLVSLLAVRCAMVTVDNIIAELKLLNVPDNVVGFWYKVKKELDLM